MLVQHVFGPLCFAHASFQPDFKHAEATFLVKSDVIKGSIRRPNQEGMASTSA
jgi:hypothetical protein